jgi:hypothetical protein
VVAIIASLLAISAYIALRFEWKYAVPVMIALMHDLLITAGVYALTGREVTADTVAALLTILGYSLYDTIIVFDRVRENVPRMPNAAFSQIVNRSMSEVLTRSLATSLVHAAADPGAAAVRRLDVEGLRVRAAGRRRLGRVLVDLHRLAGADALEGARAGVPPPARADRGRERRRRAGLRDGRRGGARGRRRRGGQAPAPAPDGAAAPGGQGRRVPRAGARPARRAGDAARRARCARAGPRPEPRCAIPTADARPEDVVMPADDAAARRRGASKSRNRRRGRPR